jgi:hypothetical protein
MTANRFPNVYFNLRVAAISSSIRKPVVDPDIYIYRGHKSLKMSDQRPVPPPLPIEPDSFGFLDLDTYIIPAIDMTSLTAPEIANINAAVIELRSLLATQLYGSTELANKYVKVPVEYHHEQYLKLIYEADYRDSINEPKKYLFIIFEDEANTSYHAIPRNVSIEPTALWWEDYNLFLAEYSTFTKFNALLFSPTGDPPISSEDAFNPHIIDVVEGNNGYPPLKDYNWTAKPYWDEAATGQDIYDAIIEYITQPN